MRYKVEDEVLAKGKIVGINIDYMHPIEVRFENGSSVWLEEKDLMPHMSNVETIPQEEIMKSAYNQGLNDAWELVKKPTLELSHNENEEVFGRRYIEDILTEMTPQEALAKLKAYEEAQSKIEVGDVVICGNDDVKAVVLDIDEPDAWLLNENRCVYEMPISDMKKLDKHIDIDNIVEQLRE